MGNAWLVSIELETVTGLIEDRIVNNFAFSGGDQASIAERDTMLQRCIDFYSVDSGAAQTNILMSYMSPSIQRVGTPHKARLYDLTGHLDGSPHGSPVKELDWGSATASSSTKPFPSECAAKVRFEAVGRSVAAVESPDGADPGSAIDRPKQRKTGGVFFGPLNADVMGTAAGSHDRLTATFITDLLEAAKKVAAPIVTTLGFDIALGVWSRSNAAIDTLEAIAVDNSFDTQRRRGRAPSAVTRVNAPF